MKPILQTKNKAYRTHQKAKLVLFPGVLVKKMVSYNFFQILNFRPELLVTTITSLFISKDSVNFDNHFKKQDTNCLIKCCQDRLYVV